MKKINIAPFKEFWQDCFNCIVYSITEYSQDVPKLYYYNNMYKYNFTEEVATECGVKYKSLVPWTDNFRLFSELITNWEKINFSEWDDPIHFIKEKIDEEKIVLLGIDLYYWIKEGLHYMKTHLIHESLVIGYDDATRELIVLETSNEVGYAEHRVDYERAVKAVREASIFSIVGEINKSVQIKMYTNEDLAFYAKQIVESIDEKLENVDDIWRIESFNDEDLTQMLLIIQTHIYSMQNRAYINAYMFENVFENDNIQGISFHDKFHEIEVSFEQLKGACIKLSYKKNKYEEIMKFKEKMMRMLELEKRLWEHYIEHYSQMQMKYKE